MSKPNKFYLVVTANLRPPRGRYTVGPLTTGLELYYTKPKIANFMFPGNFGPSNISEVLYDV